MYLRLTKKTGNKNLKKKYNKINLTHQTLKAKKHKIM